MIILFDLYKRQTSMPRRHIWSKSKTQKIFTLSTQIATSILSKNWEPWSTSTFLISIRDAGVAIQVIWHFPAPVRLPHHWHLGPSIYPHVVFPHLSGTNKTSNNRVTAFMTTPDLVSRICSLAPVWMEVPAHLRPRFLPIRIKISPIVWSPLNIQNSISSFIWLHNRRDA